MYVHETHSHCSIQKQPRAKRRMMHVEAPDIFFKLISKSRIIRMLFRARLMFKNIQHTTQTFAWVKF